jgi:hypothetical protein
MNRVQKHINEIFKPEQLEPPWPRMILCMLASTLPLAVGHLTHHLGLSIYGALTGYLLALNDHLGPLKNRFLITTLTFLFLMSGFGFGFLIQERPFEFQLCLLGLVYWLGILGGDGAEFERAVLFAVIGMVISFFSKNLNAELITQVFSFCLISFICLMIGIPILQFIYRRRPDPFTKIRDSFRKSWSTVLEKHIHAASYTIAVLASIWLQQHFKIERGYWITITVLLVMRADRTQSIYKTFQRLIGTTLAVFLCDILLPLHFTDLSLIAVVSFCAFLVPWGLKKNYVYASFFVTILVLMLLEMGSIKHGDVTTAFVRLRATLFGCGLSLLGSLISKILSSLFGYATKARD